MKLILMGNGESSAGTWYIGDSKGESGGKVVALCCPGCGFEGLIWHEKSEQFTSHQIADDGTVSPSVDCPKCEFHEHVKLGGWVLFGQSEAVSLTDDATLDLVQCVIDLNRLVVRTMERLQADGMIRVDLSDLIEEAELMRALAPGEAKEEFKAVKAAADSESEGDDESS